MSGRSVLRGLLALTALLGGSLAAAQLTQPLRCIPINQAAIPFTITLPDRCYILTQSVVAPAFTTPITINANNVELDLNGFTIVGSGPPAIFAPGNAGLKIRNGAVTGGGQGVFISAGFGDAIVEDVRFSGIGGTALFFQLLAGPGNQRAMFAARRVRITNCNRGIDASGSPITPTPLEGEIVDSQLRTNGSGISAIDAQSLLIANNRIDTTQFAPGLGFNPAIALTNVDGARVVGNTITNTVQQPGISLVNSSGNVLRRNVVSGSGSFGITLDLTSADNVIVDNQSSANLAHGLQVLGSRNRIESNLLNGNGVGNPGQVGLLLGLSSASCTIRRNVAEGNSGPAVACAAFNTTDFCDQTTANSTAGDNYMPGPAPL